MGQSLFADQRPSEADDAPLWALGVERTPASAFIRQVVKPADLSVADLASSRPLSPRNLSHDVEFLA